MRVEILKTGKVLIWLLERFKKMRNVALKTGKLLSRLPDKSKSLSSGALKVFDEKLFN
jgi:hypothetical protein